MSIKEIISKNILYLRKSNKMTQEELANKLHYSLQAVSKWERGLSTPDVDTLYQISQLFDVDVNYLFNENNDQVIDKEVEDEIRKKEIKFKIILAVSSFVIISSLLLILLTNILRIVDIKIHIFFIYYLPLIPLLALIIRMILKASGKINYILASITLWMLCNSIYIIFNNEELAIVYSIGFILQLLLIFIPYSYNKYIFKIRNKE